MDSDEIRKLLERNQPFTVHLADGRKFSVPHRDFASVSPSRRTMTVYDDQGLTEILSMVLISSLTVNEQAA